MVGGQAKAPEEAEVTGVLAILMDHQISAVNYIGNLENPQIFVLNPELVPGRTYLPQNQNLTNETSTNSTLKMKYLTHCTTLSLVQKYTQYC